MAELIWSTYDNEPFDCQEITLQKINKNTASGGGGGGGVAQGSGAPVAAPSDPTIAWIYTDTDTGTLYSWDVNLQAWI